MQRLTTQQGLAPVQNNTKPRSDVLVVAELTTRSDKTRNALKWGQPVIAAQKLLEWAGQG